MQTEGFECVNCKKWVPQAKNIGTKHRNHCPYCLWSVHLDITPGDRKAICKGKMQPIGLTFKKEGKDKYGKERQGEIVLVHKCTTCGKVSKNRVAGDDNPDKILEILKNEINQPNEEGTSFLTKSDLPVLKIQLFGRI